jgi:RNA polymerase sigma factor (sigma-70 family)
MTASGWEDGQSDMREGLRAAYARRGQDLFAFAYRLTGSSAAAEDAVHEAFVRLLDGRCRVDRRRGDLATLLFGVLRNVVREQRRRADNEQRYLVSERPKRSATGQSVPEHVLALRDALETLSDTDREVVLLAGYHGFTPAEIAVALGVNAVVVRVRLHRARARLRKALLAPPTADSLSLLRRTGHGR